MLDIQIEPAEGFTVCRPVGELNSQSVALFRRILAELATRPKLVIDISKVANVDPTGLGALIAGVRRARELGTEVAVSCGQQTLGLMRSTGFDRIVTVAESFRGAVFALSPIPLE